MARRLLLGSAVALVAVALFVAWDQPHPDPDNFTGNPCDGSIAAAFYDVPPSGEPDPHNSRECRDPARRQLVVAGVLLAVAVSLLVLRRRPPGAAEPAA